MYESNVCKCFTRRSPSSLLCFADQSVFGFWAYFITTFMGKCALGGNVRPFHPFTTSTCTSMKRTKLVAQLFGYIFIFNLFNSLASFSLFELGKVILF
jgi:hypothetical protein